jgi:6-phosphogluconolactonase
MKIYAQVNADEAAKVGAKFIAMKAREAVAARGRFVMAVSGGHDPWKMFRTLGNECLPWRLIHIFQVDERVAPTGSLNRNLTHFHESFLSHVPLRPEQFHAMPVEEMDLDTAARQYAHELRGIAGSPPVLDFVHLGLGPDGHTASLVPDDPVLEIMDRDVAITGIYKGHQRMTLTYPIFNRARCVMWLVTGPRKVEMFKRLRSGDFGIPGGRIRQDTAVAIIDLATARLQSSQPKRSRTDERLLRLGKPRLKPVAQRRVSNECVVG